MKFAHMSDVHLGSWSSHPDMKNLPVQAFERAVNMCIEEGTDFILIAGDLFDTSIPPIEALASCAALLKKCKDSGIRVYVVPGSHDYSPTGKTMLSVLEQAGLLTDVSKIEQDEKKIKLRFTVDDSGAKICGILGKMGALEKSYYETLDRSVEDEGGFKIFVMHSAISEYSPKNIVETAVPLSMLPKNFNYYANGHVHMRLLEKHGNGYLAFPGPLFPTSFDELVDYDSGFYMVTCGGEMRVERRSVKLFDVVLVDVRRETPEKITAEVMRKLEAAQLRDKVVLVRVSGVLDSGKPSEIDFNKISALAAEKGAKALKKNTSKLTTKEFREISESGNMLIEDIEKEIIAKFSVDAGIADAGKIAQGLMHALDTERMEGETVAAFEGRVKENSRKIFGMEW